MNSRSALAAKAAVAGLVVLGLMPSPALATEDWVRRIAGVDRIQTAIEVSRLMFAEEGSAPTVLLARADVYFDALAGAPLARHLGGPLLLTGSEALDDRTADEISRVLPLGKSVVLLGGSSALSPLVELGIVATGHLAERIEGADRYETAVRIAERLAPYRHLVIADGTSPADALCAAGGAASAKVVADPSIAQDAYPPYPVLLTAGTHLPEITRRFLEAHPGAGEITVGHPASSARPGAAEHLAGQDRYATCALAASHFAPRALSVGVANGSDPADGLAGAIHVAARGGVLVLSPASALSPPAREFMKERWDTLDEAYLYGGNSALSRQVHADVASAISCPAQPGLLCGF